MPEKKKPSISSDVLLIESFRHNQINFESMGFWSWNLNFESIGFWSWNLNFESNPFDSGLETFHLLRCASHRLIWWYSAIFLRCLWLCCRINFESMGFWSWNLNFESIGFWSWNLNFESNPFDSGLETFHLLRCASHRLIWWYSAIFLRCLWLCCRRSWGGDLVNHEPVLFTWTFCSI